MLYFLLYPLKDIFSIFNVLQYITFRAVSATLTSIIISLFFGRYIIEKLKELQIEESIRNDGPATHLKKIGTPTMGGIIILISVLVSTILWARLDNMYIITILVGTTMMGILGIIDDYIKIKLKNKKGLIPRYKFLGQILTAIIITYLMYKLPISKELITKTSIPLMKNVLLNYGIFFIPAVIFIIVGASNAVNITDGLDGLAIGLIAISFVGLSILAYISGNIKAASYLHMLYLPGSGELTIFTMSIIGASLGFLWYNSHPASVFMGDTGSLALGGALGITAILLKKELFLIILGGVFIIETLSVILQVGSYKLRNKKRIFKMAPIHHHFELSGWHENKVVVRFWIIGIMLLLLTLAIIKVQ